MLANKILVSAGKVKAADVDVFLKGGAAVDLKKTGQEDRGKWMPEPVQRNIVALSSMDAFRDIQDSVFRNDGLWRQW